MIIRKIETIEASPKIMNSPVVIVKSNCNIIYIIYNHYL